MIKQNYSIERQFYPSDFKNIYKFANKYLDKITTNFQFTITLKNCCRNY